MQTHTVEGGGALKLHVHEWGKPNAQLKCIIYSLCRARIAAHLRRRDTALLKTVWFPCARPLKPTLESAGLGRTANRRRRIKVPRAGPPAAAEDLHMCK